MIQYILHAICLGIVGLGLSARSSFIIFIQCATARFRIDLVSVQPFQQGRTGMEHHGAHQLGSEAPALNWHTELLILELSYYFCRKDSNHECNKEGNDAFLASVKERVLLGSSLRTVVLCTIFHIHVQRPWCGYCVVQYWCCLQAEQRYLIRAWFNGEVTR